VSSILARNFETIACFNFCAFMSNQLAKWGQMAYSLASILEDPWMLFVVSGSFIWDSHFGYCLAMQKLYLIWTCVINSLHTTNFPCGVSTSFIGDLKVVDDNCDSDI
jgi:hypothetical protein